MITINTLKKLFKRFWVLYKMYMAMIVANIFSVKPCISKGNTKIGKVLNVSLMPIKSCGNCRGCCHYCYDVKACTGQHWKAVLDARVRNQVIFDYDRSLYFWHIENALKSRRKHFYFRWHVSGEIADRDYLENMIRIAKDNPRFIFWTYTKMYSIVNEYVRDHGGDRKKAIPDNLSIMFSSGFNDVDNPYNFPLFHCRKKGTAIPKGFYHCPGNCDLCKSENNNGKARGCIAGENTWNDEH